jgi:hypothetical protein
LPRQRYQRPRQGLAEPRRDGTFIAATAFIVGFGIGIFIAGLNSDAPALWACVALIPVVVGLLSAFGPK